MPAANIDEAISFAPNYIAEVTFGTGGAAPTESLFTQMGLWIAGMFSEATGIFPPSADVNSNPVQKQRAVTDWYAAHLMAKADIEGPAVGAAGIVGSAAVTNAVERALVAVKFATVNGYITSAQQTAVVALFNTVWA